MTRTTSRFATSTTVLALLAIVLIAISARAWYSPSFGADFGHPTNDCGKNIHYVLDAKGKQICMGVVSKEIVDALTQKIQDEDMGTLNEGEIRGDSPFDYALRFIEEVWWGFK